MLGGVFDVGWYPECVEEFPQQSLLSVLRDAPPPRTRSEIVGRLAEYEPTREIVEAWVEELRRDPGDLPFPLHDTVAFHLSNLGERDLAQVLLLLQTDPSIAVRRGAIDALRLAVSEPLALPQLETTFEAALRDPDEIIARRAEQAMAAYRGTAGDPVAAVEALVRRAELSGAALQRLGMRRASCGSKAAAAKLEELSSSTNYWTQFRAKRARSSRTTLCGADVP